MKHFPHPILLIPPANEKNENTERFQYSVSMLK